jgi:hypothetical protein
MGNYGLVTSEFLLDAMDEPFYVGGPGVSPLVPGLFDISLGGHAYKLDTQYEAFRRESARSQSIPAVADKTDITNIPGEASVNTESLWRREMQDWSDGAGQLFLDRRASSSNRYKASKGVYPWLQNYASLLNDTIPVHTSGNELQVLAVGQYVFVNDGGSVIYSSGILTSWTTVSGVTANLTNNALATDGNNIYIACGTNGIYLMTSPTGSAASWITGTVNSVWYAGGQLLCAAANKLYSIWVSTSTAGPTALAAAGPSAASALLFTQLNANFIFTTCAAGNSWIYVGGYASSTTTAAVVYKLQMNSTATALLVPVAAATLPGGELVYALFAYANYIMLGTSLGARFCETLGVNDPGGNAGDLKVGPLVPDIVQPVSAPVQAFTGQFRWVWFGWSNYDTASTGIGRLDLSNFIDQQAPAYSSDLMVTGQGNITSMDWHYGLFNIQGVLSGSPIFVVSGLGVYTCAQVYVAQGVIDTGYITYGLPDNKVALQFDFNANGVAGGIGAVITVDDGVTTYTIPSQTITNVISKQALPALVGELFDLQVQINAGETGITKNDVTPILRRFQMKALPAVVSGTQHILPLNTSFMVTGNGLDYPTNPYTEFAYLDAFRQQATPILFQEGNQYQAQVVITELDIVRYSLGPGSAGGFNTVMVVFCQTLEN